MDVVQTMMHPLAFGIVAAVVAVVAAVELKVVVVAVVAVVGLAVVVAVNYHLPDWSC